METHSATGGIPSRVESIISDLTILFSREIPGLICLILGGSFGRGEGSSVSFRGIDYPFKDFDFYAVIDDASASRGSDFRDHILREAYSVVGLEPYSEEMPSPGHFRITLEILPEGSVAYLPNDISNAELKYASRILWGKDVREMIPADIGSIPPVSGLRPVLNKLIGMTEQWGPWVEHDHAISPALAMAVRYHAAKMVLDCAASVLLTSGRWVPGYRARFEVIRDIESNHPVHPFLDPLTEAVEHALVIKQRPDAPFDRSPAEIWKEAARNLLRYADILTGDVFGYGSQNHSGGYERFYDVAKRAFFDPYAKSWFRSRGIEPIPGMTRVLVLLYSLRSSIVSGRFGFVHPVIRVYAAAWAWLAHHDSPVFPRGVVHWLSTHAGIRSADRLQIQKHIISSFKTMGRRKRFKRSLR